MSLTLPSINTTQMAMPKYTMNGFKYFNAVKSTDSLPKLVEDFNNTPTSKEPRAPSTEPKNLYSNASRRRGGWWDKVESKSDEMDKIKQILRNQTIKSSRPTTVAKEDTKLEETKRVHHVSPLYEPENLPDSTAPAAEKTPTNYDSDLPNGFSSNDSKQTKAKPVSAKQRSAKVKPPWNFDLTENSGPSEVADVKNKLEQNEMHSLKKELRSQTNQLNYIKDIINENVNRRQIDSSVLANMLFSLNMPKTTESFIQESYLPSTSVNYLKLYNYIERKDFGRAVVLVQTVLASLESPPVSTLAAFDDLIYVLSKYLFILLYQNHNKIMGERTLKMVIYPMVQKEQKRGGTRSDWFVKDYLLLENLLSENVDPKNLYRNFNWSVELSRFWQGVQELEQKTSSQPSLFVYALYEYFRPISTKYDDLNTVLANAHKYEKIKSILEEETPKKKEIRKKPSSIVREYQQNIPLEINEPDEPYQPSLGGRTKKPVSDYSSLPESSASHKYRSEELPPVGAETENCNFALLTVCGPSIGTIRCMDVLCLPETGQIIAITAGDDKDISVWDIRANQRICSLTNNSVKPIVFLMFHPSYPELLLSADMEFDVKLWNWKDASLVRWWKKHHGRIIYKLGFIPGDDTRAVSCSGDQTLKMFNFS